EGHPPLTLDLAEQAPTDELLAAFAAIVTLALDAAQRVASERRRRREAEAEAEELQGVFAEAPAAVAVQRGPEHVYELANPGYVAIIGRDDVIGRTRREVLPDEAYGSILLDRVYRTGEPY